MKRFARGSMMITLIILVSVAIGDVCSEKTILIVTDEGDHRPTTATSKATILHFTAPKAIENEDLYRLCAMGRPDLLLDFTKNGIPSESIKKYARHMQIPTITTTYGEGGDIDEWKNLTVTQKKFLVQIKRPEDIVPDMIRKIVLRNRYKDAGILHDDKFHMVHKLKTLLINLEVNHNVREINNKNLLFMVGLRIFNFFIVASMKSAKSILKQACVKGLYEDVYSFHVITLEGDDEFVKCGYAKYVFTQPDLEPNLYRNGLTNALHSDIIKLGEEIVKTIPSYGNFSECPSREVDNMNSGGEVTDLLALLKKAIPQVKGLIMNFELNGARNVPVLPMKFTGVELYDSKMQTEIAGYWSSTQGGTFINAEGLKKYSSKIVYRIAVAVQEPFLHPDDNSVYNYSGICVDIMHEISIKMGFTFSFYRPDQTYYREDFSKLVDEVVSKRAHIAIGSISVTADRQKNVSFSIPFYEAVGTQIMMKMPEASKSFFKIVEVIHIGVWICVVVTFFVTSAMLWCFERWSPHSYRNTKQISDDPEDSEERVFTAMESLWYNLTSIISMGDGDAPRCLSSRILTGSWLLFGYMIVNAYSANLSAFLTASHLESSIESLDDLFNQQKVKYGVVNNSMTKEFFDSLARQEAVALANWSKEVLHFNETNINGSFYTLDYPLENQFTKMQKLMRDSKLVLPNFEDGKRRVQASTSSEKFAFIGDTTDIKFAILTHCDLQSVGDEFDKKFYAFAIPEKSDLKGPIDDAIIELMNDRVLEEIKNKWWRENPKAIKCSDDKYQADGITLQNIVGVFLVIAGGVVIAMIINWLDKVMKKKQAATNAVRPVEEVQN